MRSHQIKFIQNDLFNNIQHQEDKHNALADTVFIQYDPASAGSFICNKGPFDEQTDNNEYYDMNKLQIFPGAAKLLSPKEREVLEVYNSQGGTDGRMLEVSGQPLHVFGENETTDMHFDQCSFVAGLLVHVHSVSLQKIPRLGHPFVPEHYISETGYPLMQCFTCDETEIIMGIRSVLGFEMHNVH